MTDQHLNILSTLWRIILRQQPREHTKKTYNDKGHFYVINIIIQTFLYYYGINDDLMDTIILSCHNYFVLSPHMYVIMHPHFV